MTRWLLRWLDDRIERAIQSRLQAIRISYADPLREFDSQRHLVTAQAHEAANVVGKDVMVGDGVLIWGGKGQGVVGLELHDGVRLYPQCCLVIDHASAASGIVEGVKGLLGGKKK